LGTAEADGAVVATVAVDIVAIGRDESLMWDEEVPVVFRFWPNGAVDDIGAGEDDLIASSRGERM
jgi:microcompartment protein CcmK/EutM